MEIRGSISRPAARRRWLTLLSSMPELRDSVCISCHLEGDISVERAGHSALDFKAGDPISDYLAYFVYSGQGATKRGVSEVEQLSLSMCKRTSGDAMSCMSCHDPHYTPTGPQEQAAFYRKKCLACHTGATFATAHHAENPDCTSCHMPRTGAENIPHVAWTDHRILKYPEVHRLKRPKPARRGGRHTRPGLLPGYNQARYGARLL